MVVDFEAWLGARERARTELENHGFVPRHLVSWIEARMAFTPGEAEAFVAAQVSALISAHPFELTRHDSKLIKGARNVLAAWTTFALRRAEAPLLVVFADAVRRADFAILAPLKERIAEWEAAMRRGAAEVPYACALCIDWALTHPDSVPAGALDVDRPLAA